MILKYEVYILGGDSFDHPNQSRCKVVVSDICKDITHVVSSVLPCIYCLLRSRDYFYVVFWSVQ